MGVGENSGQGAVVGPDNAVLQQLFDVIGVLAEDTEQSGGAQSPVDFSNSVD
jgi:hypothetical protein